MPYTKIIWIKLFLSLLSEDDRFLYQLNESQQLLYIKMLLLAGITNNHITKNLKFICHKLNYCHEEACFLSDISRIKEVFPRFKEDDFYYFENFDNLHNQVRDSQRIAKGFPKATKGLDQIKSKSKRRVDKSTPQEFLSTLKTSDAYKHIAIDNELLKMDAWLAQHPGRKKTPRFVLNWLNKIEAPLETVKKVNRGDV